MASGPCGSGEVNTASAPRKSMPSIGALYKAQLSSVPAGVSPGRLGSSASWSALRVLLICLQKRGSIPKGSHVQEIAATPEPHDLSPRSILGRDRARRVDSEDNSARAIGVLGYGGIVFARAGPGPDVPGPTRARCLQSRRWVRARQTSTFLRTRCQVRVHLPVDRAPRAWCSTRKMTRSQPVDPASLRVLQTRQGLMKLRRRLVPPRLEA